ncbi:MAG TPA: DUF3027 domain-containing protein [Nocardioidaceae bacterium]|nr:DUF3027 domain-containing protein [Nocardioidaceae bacterium]
MTVSAQPAAPLSSKPPKADAQLAAAVEEARAVLADSAGDSYGEHLGSVAEGERLVTHYFEAELAGYRGWRWAVTITRAPRSKTVTVDEVVMLPGEGALQAPEWVPWKERVRPSDLGPGDLVPAADDDPRLVPGYLVGDQPLTPSDLREEREVACEVGLGRRRVLSVAGRDEAADRWYAGAQGPTAPIAQAAPGHCGTCGFLVRIGGPLGSAFGVCANAASPSDGQAVSLDHGCGAHSDVHVEPPQIQLAADEPVLDTVNWDAWSDSDLEPIS